MVRNPERDAVASLPSGRRKGCHVVTRGPREEETVVPEKTGHRGRVSSHCQSLSTRRNRSPNKPGKDLAKRVCRALRRIFQKQESRRPETERHPKTSRSSAYPLRTGLSRHSSERYRAMSRRTAAQSLEDRGHWLSWSLSVGQPEPGLSPRLRGWQVPLQLLRKAVRREKGQPHSGSPM